MKPKSLGLVLIISVLAIGGAGIVSAYTPLGAPASITSQGQVPFTPGALLDDFSGGTSINKWGALTGTFSKSTVVPPPANESCKASYVLDASQARGGCLKLEYNVDAADTYAGYYSLLGGASLVTPVAYTAVSFYVKGAAGGEFFKIQLKKTSSSAAVYITDYLDGGVTTGWQKVTVPFHNFVNLDNGDSMTEFVIVFENAQSATNGSLTHGTVYIDNITFETTTVPVVRIDHFGDKLGTCALGGNMGTMTGAGGVISYSFSNIAGEYSGYPYGLNLNYDVTAYGAWAGVWSLFGGGADGWTAVPHDFSAYNYLYIGVRGSSTGNPKEIKIELVDSGGSKAVRINTITASWQYWRIPLVFNANANPGFIGLDKSSIKQLNIIVEGNQVGYANGNKSGNVYIDSVQFEQ